VIGQFLTAKVYYSHYYMNDLNALNYV